MIYCRSCGGPTAPLLDLGSQPLANHLLASPDESYETYPLRMVLCMTCHLGQLANVVPPEFMFHEYVYYTSVSGPSVESAHKLVDSIAVPTGGCVVEIGSNDGYLLQFYKQRGIPVLGIDPASGPADVASDLGIPTVREFFTTDLARLLPQADVIHANNVLAHVPDLNDFVAGLAIMLKPNGTCYVEVPYLGTLLRDCRFDTIYHEHSYYFSYRALYELFERYGLYIEQVQRLEAHGGSLRLHIAKSERLFWMNEDILRHGGDSQERMNNIASNLKSILASMRDDGKTVWGFGAAAKATVMMNYCGITSDLIEAVADETPAKIGKYIPGTGIQVRHPSDWLAAIPDYTCVFAWNHSDAIDRRYADSFHHWRLFTPYNFERIKEKTA